MLSLNTSFSLLANLALVSLAVLSIGTCLTWCWTRAIERSRCIQATMVAVLAACLLQQLHLLPQVSLGWLTDNFDVTVGASNRGSTDIPVVANAVQNHSTSSEVADRADFAKFVADSASNAAMPPASTSANQTQNTVSTVTRPMAVSGPLTARWLQFASLGVFLLGAAGTLFSIAIGVSRLRKLRRHCRAAPVEIVTLIHKLNGPSRRTVDVLVSNDVDVPLTYGIRKPVIVLPIRMLSSAQESMLNHCLAHEWSHIRRHDIAQWWLWQAMQPLFWYQPLYWVLRRELRLCQDQIADDFAAGQSTDCLSYAESLLELAKQRRREQLTLALTMNDGQSNLYRRIQLLVSVNHRLTSVCRSWVVGMAVLILLVTGGALGTINLGHAAAPIAVAENNDAAEPQSVPSVQAASVDEKMSADQKAIPAVMPQKLSDGSAKAADVDPSVMGEELPDGSLRYSGVVVDKTSSRPVPKAVVTVRRMILSSTEHRTLEETKHTTDEVGKYSFVIPPAQMAEKSLYIELDVEHPDFARRAGFGYALSMIRKNAKLGDPPFYAKLELDPSEFITGRLIDPEGKPLAGVPIEAFSTANVRDFEGSSWFETKTDSEGKFRLNIAKGGPSVFWIVPEKLAPKQIVSGTKRGDWGDVQLEMGVGLKGQVVDSTGKPLAGVWANFTDRKSQSEIQIPVASQLSRSGQTEKDGTFEIGPVKPGTYELEVSNYPHELRYHSRERKQEEISAVFPRRTVTINESMSEPLIVRAVPHVQFEGQYFDSKGAKKPGGWEISVFGKLDGDSYFGRLSPNAEGTIHGMLPHGLENTQLDVVSNEHGAIRVRLGKDKPLVGGRRLSIGTVEADLTGIEIVRYTAPIVQLKVVDEEGKAIPNVKVAGIYESADKENLVYPVDGMPTSIFFEKQPGGILRSSQMLPDEKTKFVASAEGYEDAQELLSMPEGETHELTLVLKRASVSNSDKGAPAAKMEKPEK